MSTTIAYSHKGGYWKTKYSFFASFMQSVGRKFFSSPSAGATFFGGRAQFLLWKHNSDDDSKRTNFYGVASGSGMSVSFNDKVSSNKIYKSFSIEGTNNISGSALNTFIVNSDNNPNKQFSIGPVKDKGGILYGHIGLSNTLLDGSNIEAIGTLSANSISNLLAYGTGPMIAFEASKASLKRSFSAVQGKSKYILMDGAGNFYSINGAPISQGLSQDLTYSDPALGEPLHLNKFVNFVGNSVIQFAVIDSPFNGIFYTGGNYLFSSVLPVTVPTTLLEITPQNINGAPPRGQYAQAEIFLGTEPYEIFSLNVNYEPTDLDHSK